MREIKFRAWDEKNKRWYKDSDPDCVLEFDGSITQINVVGQYDGELFYSFDDKEGLILVQYTGLKDKNGKEIYEGDIIFHHHRKEEYRLQGVVRYEEQWAGFYFAENRGMNKNTKYEVLGNIYENPELLEKK